MKIVFNLVNNELKNNGISYTIIESANTILELGYDIKIISNDVNKNTKLQLNSDYIIVNNLKEIPKADVIIGIGIDSFKSTFKSKIKKKFLWILDWEVNNKLSEGKFIKQIKESNCNIIVGSLNIKNKLKEYSIDSNIIMPGYDTDIINPLNIRNNNNVLNIGGIYNHGQIIDTKRTSWIFKVYKDLKKEFQLILNMYASEGPGNFDYFSYNLKKKNEEYNRCHIWLAPTCLDGLHIPAAEAGLTESCVIATKVKMNGMSDYLNHNKTGLLSENNYESFREHVRFAISNEKLRNELGKNLRKKILKIGSKKDNMKKLTSLIKGEILNE